MRLILLSFLYFSVLISHASPFGIALCKSDPRFYCANANSKELKKIYHRVATHPILSQINRVNIGLSGKIAVPKNPKQSLLSLGPFPLRMPAALRKLIFVDLKQLAWGAYDAHGQLLRWGAISPGKDYCADEKASCRTKTGKFKVYQKGTIACKSRKYPKPQGGAPMKYCMFFHGGMAMHVGKLPGKADSHGCVRTAEKDAEWLNKHFVDVGTPVIVR